MAAKIDPPPRVDKAILPQGLQDWLRKFWLNAAQGAASVSSVGLALPNIFSITGSPVTTSGTLTAAFVTQTANQVFAGPSSGAAAIPAFRALVVADQVDGRLSKSVAGAVDVTLSATEAFNTILEFTGIITASINVIVPVTVRQWIVFNNTTGAFTLTVKTSGGTGITVGQGKRCLLYSDTTNVVRATADV